MRNCPYCRKLREAPVGDRYCSDCKVWVAGGSARTWWDGKWRPVPEGTLLVLDRWSWPGRRRRR